MEKVTQTKQKIKYTMCGRSSSGGCCPVLEEVEDSKFTIVDDYEGKVVLTKDELKLLKDYLNTTEL